VLWQIREREQHIRLLLTIADVSLSLGDLKWKPYGVTPEPDVRTMLLEGVILPVECCYNFLHPRQAPNGRT
jgi:hypothetical protein